MKKDYKDLYAMGILTVLALVVTPIIMGWWSFTLETPIRTVQDSTVSTETIQNTNKKLNSEDLSQLNQETMLIAVKAMELSEGGEKYYFLRNNEGDLYISENQELKNNKNYVLEINRKTGEIVEYRLELEFEFDSEDERLFDEWYDSDIEQGREMLNEYLGIENYTEVSV